MHAVKIDDGEYEIVKEAIKQHEWRILPTWKLKYLYQRFTKDYKQIKEIGLEARKCLNKELDDRVDVVKKEMF